MITPINYFVTSTINHRIQPLFSQPNASFSNGNNHPVACGNGHPTLGAIAKTHCYHYIVIILMIFFAYVYIYNIFAYRLFYITHPFNFITVLKWLYHWNWKRLGRIDMETQQNSNVSSVGIWMPIIFSAASDVTTIQPKYIKPPKNV